MTDQSSFIQFVESVKEKVPINELYTFLSKEEFVYIDSRPRARIIWREDKTPSLSFYAQQNKLTDFTDIDPITGKFKNYNHIDLFKKIGGAISFGDAVIKLCEYAKIEIPSEFKREDKEDGGLSLNLGKKVREVWQACLDNMEQILSNPNKYPINMINFFEARNIPLDVEFLRAINIGICPDYDSVYSMLKDHNILEKKKKKDVDGSEERNIFKKILENNALVFPLYNLDGGLCGLKFRQFDSKDFAEWNPTKVECFFNGQRFSKRPHDKYLYLTESEMSVIAYARGSYDILKKNSSEKLRERLEDSLTIIYATGTKKNTVRSFANECTKIKYIQDQDIKDYEEVFRPELHPVLQTCTHIATQLEVDDFLVVDWQLLPYVNQKYDFEDFLKYHNYDLASMKDLPFISFPRYAVNIIKQYISTIQNEDNKKQVRIKFSFLFADKMPTAQRAVFEEICKEEFKLEENIAQSIKSIDRNITCGPYSIDTLGRFVETVVDEKNHTTFTNPKTNFYLRINNDITYYNSMNGDREKRFEVEVVINNSNIISGELSGSEIVDGKKVLEFLGNTCWNDLDFIDPAYNSGDKFAAVKSMMQKIPAANKIAIFSSMGKPTDKEEEADKECAKKFKTEKYCLYPQTSVINGRVITNKTQNFEVNLTKKGLTDTTLFQWSNVDEDTFRKAGRIFWKNLRNMHYSYIIDSMVAMAFDCCTRELQGEGIVENDHGFPLYIAGKSGRYKSTCALAAMYLMGKFKNPQGDFLCWNGTRLSIEHQLIKVGNLIHVLDDLKVEGLKNAEFVALIHAIYGSNTKTRMSPGATEIHGGNKLKCSLVVTSEAEPSDIPESIATRFLVLRIPPPPEDLPEQWEKNFRFMQQVEENGKDNADLMTCIMPRAIAWAQNRNIMLYPQSLRKWKDILTTQLKEEKNDSIERPSDMIARIIAAYEQFVEFCKETEICSIEEGDIAFKELVEFWQEKIELQITRIAKQSATYKIIDLLWQILYTESIGIKVFNNNKWIEPKRNFNQGCPILDITYPDERGRKLVILSLNTLVKHMNNLLTDGFTIAMDRFITEFKESGIIEVDSNGKDVRYPVPDDRGNINEKKFHASGIVIDYNKLMNIYKEMKND